jgi:hypothetical protein
MKVSLYFLNFILFSMNFRNLIKLPRIFIRKMEFGKKENIWTIHADLAHNYNARGPASRDAWWLKGWMVLGLAGQVRCQSGLAGPVATSRCARAQSPRPQPTGWHSGRWWPGGLGAWRWPSRARGIQAEGSSEVVEEEGSLLGAWEAGEKDDKAPVVLG